MLMLSINKWNPHKQIPFEFGFNRGQAYIFKNDGADNWNQVAIFTASDGEDHDHFGYSVFLNETYVIIGADPYPDISVDGKAYIFKNDGADRWTEIVKLPRMDMNVGYGFGESVCISDTYAIIGDGGIGKAFILY